MFPRSLTVATRYIANKVGALSKLPLETLCEFFSYEKFEKKSDTIVRMHSGVYTYRMMEFLKTEKPEDMPEDILIECFDWEKFGQYLIDNKIAR